MHLLTSLLFLLLFAVLIIVFGALGIIRSLFGHRNNRPPEPPSSATRPTKRTKYFSPDQGEYVDFEEVDEDKS